MNASSNTTTPSRSKPVSAELLARLENPVSGKWTVVEQSGNFGDMLIWAGAYKLLEAHSIPYEVIGFRQFLQNTGPMGSVYLHGGGNLGDKYPASWNVIEHALAHGARELVVGPQTVYASDEWISQTFARSALAWPEEDVNITMFCREEVSFDLLKNVCPEMDIRRDHDCALNLTTEDFITGSFPRRLSLFVRRRDREGDPAMGPAPRSSFACDPVLDCQFFYDWLALHLQAKRIETNRLHSAIFGTISGAEVILHPNSYFKNRAIWEYSLRDRNVQWGPDLPGHAPERPTDKDGNIALKQFRIRLRCWLFRKTKNLDVDACSSLLSSKREHML
jgi:exopolysaccharide biosynthesis predicted pyruvyltransferase EpsI